MTDLSFTFDTMATSEPISESADSTGLIESPAPEAKDESYRFLHPSNPDSAYQRAHWEIADTDRLNEAHWRFAQEMPVNDALRDRLSIIRARAVHESGNNPTLEGLKLQHTVAIHGESGPTVDLQSEDEAGDQWATEAEDLFESWAECADAAGSRSLADMLKHFNFSCWDDGEFLFQRVNEDRRFRKPSIPDLRLKTIEAQRLKDPMGAASLDVVLGIRRNQHGRPLDYWIEEPLHRFNQRGNWIPADLLYHGFDDVQARSGQVRGIPWSQWGLPVAADVRDYDFQVLDAARQVADNPLFAYTEHADSEFAGNVPKELTYRRRKVNFLAPGWKPNTPPPTHPGAHYTDHRQELHGDVGKAKGVPSMVTRLDARDHSYSSARFDYSLLGESANHCRNTMYTPLIRKLVREVIFEAVAMRLIAPPPSAVFFELVWPQQPAIDQQKAANAENTYLGNGTVAYSDAISRNHGKRTRDVIRIRARDNRQLVAAGLPTVEETVSRNAVAVVEEKEEDGTKKTGED